MKLWLEIQRASGIDRREIRVEEGAGIAEGKCPGCNAEPFVVASPTSERITADLTRGQGKCLCCGDSVGYIFAENETIFGAEEDRAVLAFGRARVYGGGIRP